MTTDSIRHTLAVAFCLAWTGLTASQAVWAQAPVSVVSFGAIADGVMRKDGAMSPNSPVLTSASGSFTAADQGKYIQVIGAGPGGTSRTDGAIAAGSSVLTSGSNGFVSSDVGRCIVVSGAGAGGGNLVGRIQSFNSPSSVVLSVSAQTSVSGVFFNYGGMTLEATIQSVQSSSAVTLSTPAFALISAATYAYGTDNHAAFQRAVDTVGQSGGGQVNVPAPSTCAGGAVCGYVVKASDQQTAQAPGAVKIRYSNVSLVGDAPQTNLFCRGAFGVYTNTVAFPGTTGNIRGFCLTIGDNGGPNGAAGEAVSNVTISQLHLYGMTNGNTFNVNFAYPPTTPTGDGWDVTHKAIYMWDNSAFSNIVINSIILQDFKAENIYSGGSVITGMIIRNSTITNFNGNGISMLAASLQVLNNTISNGSNAAVENSTVSMGSQALVNQLYQGNTISLIPREGIVVVGVDNGVAAGTVQIVNNTFDTIAQINPSGTESAIYIASQNNFLPPANVTVTGNTCHDCQTFGVFQTSGNTLIQGNNFIVDHYDAGSVFGFTNALNNVTISNNTGSSTAQAQASHLNVGAVYVLNPGYVNGSFQWKNVIVKGNSWTFPGAPQYQFVTTSGAGWNLVTQDNLRWQGDVCNGCTHTDLDHGVVNLSGTTTIRPYGPVVYVNGNNSPVNATVDASKEEDGSQLQIINAGTNAVNFSSDNNLSLASTYTLQPGSSLNLLYSAAVGRFIVANAAINVNATAGTPQSVTVNQTFSTALQATVTNSSNAPMSGVSVTFAAPTSGASATFSGLASVVAVTGTNGVATAPALTANGQAGAYVVTASVAGAGSSASYLLTNTPGASGGKGALTGTGTSSTATVNLTAEGGSDWVHWGDLSLTRKAGVTAQLSSYTPIGGGTILTYSNDPRGVSWTDGTPLASASATNNGNGIYVAGLGLGFSITAPADTTSRTLTLHVGGWFSAGTLTAHLSDGSAADFTDVTGITTGQYDRNYTLVYQAGSAGQSLIVSWVTTAGPGYGNVTLNAAALTGAASSAVTISSNAGTPQSATIGTAFATALQATVRDSNNNPVSGVSVTFAAPTSGASATFGGSSSVSAVTGSTGIATAPTLTANSQAGGYLVVASVAGATSSASFTLTNTGPSVLSISATGGTPQSATVGTAFATALQATVKDSNNNPVSGATVTFAAPTSGAAGTFAGLATISAVTGTNGIATAPTFTANSQTGGYLVFATVPGGASSAPFSLTNTASAVLSISATGGTPQSAADGTTFATPLQATVKDSNNNPVSGATVTFTAPTSGASGSFSGAATITATTGTTGIATAPAFTANGQAGGYLVVATVPNGASSALFSLTNTAPVTISVGATGGTPQNAPVGTVFATPLQATVKDSNGNPVSGATVTFTAPANGATGTFGGSAAVTATTGTNGITTSPTFTANSQTGTYLVVATVANGTSGAQFSLTNTAPALLSISATGGTPQSANTGAAFPSFLQATVKDANNNPLSGVTVTFAAPASGASGTFNGPTTVAATSGSGGIATAPQFYANNQAGSYLVVATIANGASSALFSLTNNGPVTISVSATGGTPQSATAGTTFATLLQATVKDSNNNPVSGATVTFAAPNNGASGTFSGSANVTAVTGTTGIATAPAFTANSQTGNYAVVATIANSSSSALFVLTNTAPVTISVNATGGTPQSATVGTAFATSLQATVKDSNNNPVAGAIVTFAAPASGASGTFSSSLTATAITGTTGIAIAPAFTANSQTGGYLVAATVANGASGAQFSLTNTVAPTISISATGGTPQSATVGTAFALPLQATVMNSANAPIAGATVTFTAPASGPGATFTGSLTSTAVTGATGIATAIALTANSQTGSYSVVATVAGVSAGATFSLTNNAATAPPGNGALTGVGTSAATPVNLTSEGTSDWIHWGDSGLNRKAGVTPQLSSYTPVGNGSVIAYNNDLRPVNWTDGSPTPSASNDLNGVYINATGQGFSFTAPADTTVRTLTVHVGGWLSGGTLTAHLSDNSAADFTDVTSVAGGQYDRNYTLTYHAASASQTITVFWQMSSGSGNVTINAAALAGSPQSAPPAPGTLTAIADSSTAGANLTAEGVTDWIHWGDGALNRKGGVNPVLSTYSVIGGGTVNGYANDPRSVMWTDGSPTTVSTNNSDGVYINSVGNGFAFTAPADTTVRTLTIHVGGWFSGATLIAHLSDGSAADYMNSTPTVSSAFDRNYTVTYNAATAGQTLTINWINTASGGNVTLNGAALR